MVVLVVVLIAAVAIAYQWTGIPGASGAYQESIQEAKAQGLIFDREQALKLVTIDESENAALHVPKSLGLNDFNVRIGDKRSVDQYWKKIAPEVQKFEAALKRPHFREHINIDNPLYDINSPLISARSFERACSLVAGQAIMDNDLPTARRLLSISASAANHVGEGPTTIALIISATMESHIYRELVRIIELHGNDPAWQQLVVDTVKTLEKPVDLRPFVLFEHWTNVRALVTARRSKPTLKEAIQLKDLPNFLRYGPLLPRFEEASEARINQYYTQFLQEYPKDISDMNGVNRAWQMAKSSVGKDWSYGYIDMMADNFGYLAKILGARMANRNVLRQAIAIMQNHADPAKGLPLTGKAAIDVDGKPIRLKRVPSGWILYSVSQDRNDDLGDRKLDFVVNLPR